MLGYYAMSTIQEIELAIRSLSKSDREQLAEDLRVILPELNADGEWATIIQDPRPRPALTARSQNDPPPFSQIGEL